jgi:hypothetical protein
MNQVIMTRCCPGLIPCNLWVLSCSDFMDSGLIQACGPEFVRAAAANLFRVPVEVIK